MAQENIFSIFNEFPEVTVALSNKLHGSMKIQYELGKEDTAIINRKKFFKQHNINIHKTVVAQLAQHNHVSIIKKMHQGSYIPQTDGLLTNDQNVFLTVTVADCLPIYLYDPKTKTVGLLHAGWKGLHANIIDNAIKTMIKEFRTQSRHMFAGIGPSIDV